VKLDSIEQMILLLPTVLWHQRMRKYVKRYKKELFCNAEILCEEAGGIFYSMQQNYKKKLKREYNFLCLNIFKSYFTISATMYFADKNKVNLIYLSQKL
jgi:hypothetical protein